ncbi:hypothetical protein Pelo_5801 [Pelomyxa schiedti]|nr:hypothetical protein Pelo_5801 [Pelomyxa schiedti]
MSNTQTQTWGRRQLLATSRSLIQQNTFVPPPPSPWSGSGSVSASGWGGAATNTNANSKPPSAAAVLAIHTIDDLLSSLDSLGGAPPPPGAPTTPTAAATAATTPAPRAATPSPSPSPTLPAPCPSPSPSPMSPTLAPTPPTTGGVVPVTHRPAHPIGMRTASIGTMRNLATNKPSTSGGTGDTSSNSSSCGSSSTNVPSTTPPCSPPPNMTPPPQLNPPPMILHPDVPPPPPPAVVPHQSTRLPEAVPPQVNPVPASVTPPQSTSTPAAVSTAVVNVNKSAVLSLGTARATHAISASSAPTPSAENPSPSQSVVQTPQHATLTQVLANQSYKDAFYIFLQKRHCGEVLDFYEAVDLLKANASLLLGNSNDSSGFQVWAEMVLDVHTHFISDDSMTQVNLPGTIFNSINTHIAAREYPVDIYDTAQEEMKKMMESDSFPHFIVSPAYKTLQKEQPLPSHSQSVVSASSPSIEPCPPQTPLPPIEVPALQTTSNSGSYSAPVAEQQKVCGKCQNELLPGDSNVCIVKGSIWHTACITCIHCDTPMFSDNYTTTYPCCSACEMFNLSLLSLSESMASEDIAPSCMACDQRIDDSSYIVRRVTGLIGKLFWHQCCFQCRICPPTAPQELLSKTDFKFNGDEMCLYCKAHFPESGKEATFEITSRLSSESLHNRPRPRPPFAPKWQYIQRPTVTLSCNSRRRPFVSTPRLPAFEAILPLPTVSLHSVPRLTAILIQPRCMLEEVALKPVCSCVYGDEEGCTCELVDHLVPRKTPIKPAPSTGSRGPLSRSNRFSVLFTMARPSVTVPIPPTHDIDPLAPSDSGLLTSHKKLHVSRPHLLRELASSPTPPQPTSSSRPRPSLSALPPFLKLESAYNSGLHASPHSAFSFPQPPLPPLSRARPAVKCPILPEMTPENPPKILLISRPLLSPIMVFTMSEPDLQAPPPTKRLPPDQLKSISFVPEPARPPPSIHPKAPLEQPPPQPTPASSPTARNETNICVEPQALTQDQQYQQALQEYQKMKEARMLQQQSLRRQTPSTQSPTGSSAQLAMQEYLNLRKLQQERNRQYQKIVSSADTSGEPTRSSRANEREAQQKLSEQKLREGNELRVQEERLRQQRSEENSFQAAQKEFQQMRQELRHQSALSSSGGFGGDETCFICTKMINSTTPFKLVPGLNKRVHNECLTCATCCNVISGRFGMRNGRFYCESCFINSRKEVATLMCHACGLPISGSAPGKTADQKNWHLQCFCCNLCKLPFDNQLFIKLKDKYLCPPCHERVIAALKARLSQAL